MLEAFKQAHSQHSKEGENVKLLKAVQELVGLEIVVDMKYTFDDIEHCVTIKGARPRFVETEAYPLQPRFCSGYQLIEDATSFELLIDVSFGTHGKMGIHPDFLMFDECQVVWFIKYYCGLNQGEPIAGLPQGTGVILLPIKTDIGYTMTCITIDEKGGVIVSFRPVESDNVKWGAEFPHFLFAPMN